MAAASFSRQLLNPQLRRPGFFTNRRMCNPFSALSPRAVNGDREQSPEEEARKGLKQLDEQLFERSSPSSPRPRNPFFGAEIDDLQKKATSKGSLPDFSDGFILFLGGGLILLTIVNNFLFYYFIERPAQESQVTVQSAGKKSESRTSSVDGITEALRPQASTDM